MNLDDIDKVPFKKIPKSKWRHLKYVWYIFVGTTMIVGIIEITTYLITLIR